MGIRKKLGLGIGAAALGLSLVGGGTYAYFSDTAVQASTFASGTLDLNVDPTVLVDLKDIAPGDYTNKTFKLVNNGSIDIKNVKLKTEYTITKADGTAVSQEIQDKYAQALEVEFLTNKGDNARDHQVITTKNLKYLASVTPDNLAKELDQIWYTDWQGKIVEGWVITDGIKAGSGNKSTDDFSVRFKFKDNGTNQNELQGLKLNLTWTFEGVQRDGIQK